MLTSLDVLINFGTSVTPSRQVNVVQIATGIASIARVGRVGEDPREEVGVGLGVVECELKETERAGNCPSSINHKVT